MPQSRMRTSARALVMDRDYGVLLVHFDFVAYPGGLWACPGGGLEVGETLEQAVTRELLEETGLRIEDPGEPIWFKSHVFVMPGWDGQNDTYFLVQTERFEPRPLLSEVQLRAEHVDALRWWTYDELGTAQSAYDAGEPGDPANAVFSPRGLFHLVCQLREGGRPVDPIDVTADEEN